MADTATAGSRFIDVALWIVAIACVVATIGFSVIPPPTLAASSLSDKWLHGLAYIATVGSLLLAAVWRPGRGDGRFPRAAIPITIGAIVIGGLLELVQGFLLENRQMEWLDLGVDVAGSLLALGLWAALRGLVSRATA